MLIPRRTRVKISPKYNPQFYRLTPSFLARTSVNQESDLWDNPSGVGTFSSTGFFSSDGNETMLEPLEIDLKVLGMIL